MGWGVGDGLTDIKANSAQFQVKFPTGAELGNNEESISSKEYLTGNLSTVRQGY